HSRVGGSGACGEVQAVNRRADGDLAFGGGADAACSVARRRAGVDPEETGTARETRAPTGCTADRAGGNLQPGAVSTGGCDLFELCSAPDDTGAPGDRMYEQDAARNLCAGLCGGSLHGV